MAESGTFEGWAILELMGHRRLAGYVSEQEIAGSALLRIDVPGPDGATVATQFYSAGAIYCITPTTKEAALAVAKGNQPEPVRRWELPAAAVGDSDDDLDYPEGLEVEYTERL